MNNRPTNRLIAFGSLLVAMTLAGCAPIGVVAHALKDPNVPAVYKLPERSTVVLVDDPARSLGPEQLTVDMATMIGSHLKEKEAVKSIVSQQKVNDLRHGLGEKFSKQPVDVIGRDVGAAQVIHVHVRSVTYMAEPGMIQPKATVLVKVIDVASRKRLFPPPNAEETDSKLPLFKGGLIMTAAMRERVFDSIGADQQLKVFQIRLTEFTAERIAELFYKHEPQSGLRRQ